MSENHQPLPSREQELALHGRLAAFDPTAPPDLAVTYLTPLIECLSTQNKKTLDDLCYQAAEEAILSLIKSPNSYNPNRGKTLFGFLKMSAQKDLQNLLRKERRHQKNREHVELSQLDGKYSKEDADPCVSQKADMVRAKILPVVQKGLSEAELRVLDLVLSGEKKTAVLAQAYGIADVPKDEKKKQMKKVTDKLKQRIKRARADHG